MNIDFQKSGGLVPAIIQDERSGDVLMLGFMNAESLRDAALRRSRVFQPLPKCALEEGRIQRPRFARP